MGSVVSSTGVTVSFAERYAASEQFDAIFKEGMALVETTAAYLDGSGRKAAKALSPALAALYATESMRLTTRLLELASWLLVRRSLKTGEITLDEARVKRRRIRLAVIGRPAHTKGFTELPQGLQDLVEQSIALNDRIYQIDRALEAPVSRVVEAGTNPVAQQIERLTQAFPGRNERQ